MFGLNDRMQYYVCQRYVRMNLGINGLFGIVRTEMEQPPLGGAVFILFSKNRQQLKAANAQVGSLTMMVGELTARIESLEKMLVEKGVALEGQKRISKALGKSTARQMESIR